MTPLTELVLIPPLKLRKHHERKTNKIMEIKQWKQTNKFYMNSTMNNTFEFRTSVAPNRGFACLPSASLASSRRSLRRPQQVWGCRSGEKTTRNTREKKEPTVGKQEKRTKGSRPCKKTVRQRGKIKNIYTSNLKTYIEHREDLLE